MKCPSCGFEQAPSESCINCGIMFSKFDPRRSALPFGGGAPNNGPGGGIGPAPGFAQGTMSPRIDRTDDPLEMPIGQSALIARVLAGLGALGIAWLMFASGSALQGFFPYLLMVFYVGSGMWTLATARNEVIAKQFAIEIIILVFVSAMARMMYPQVFAADYEEQRAAVANAELPNKYEGYLVRSEAFATELVLFIAKPKPAPGTDKAAKAPEPSKERLDAGWKAVQQRYRTAVKSGSPGERQKGFQMHESYRHALDIYETIAPELRRITTARKAGQELPMILPGPVLAKVNELLPVWTSSLERLEAQGKSSGVITPMN